MKMDVDLPTIMDRSVTLELNCPENTKLNPKPIDFVEIYNNIYENYENIIESTTEVFKSALKTAYAGYNKILEIRNENVEKFDKIVGCTDSPQIDNVIDADPKQSIDNVICNILFKYHDGARVICEHEYTENALDIGDMLDRYNDSQKIPLYGIENSYEIRPSTNRNSAFVLDTIIFKIRPILKNINLGIDNKPIPVIDHLKVLYDYISICNFCLANSDFVKDVEEITTEELFIENNIVKFNSVIQDLSKKIILEMFDRISDIYGNFDKFNDKLTCASRELRESDIYQNVLRKIEWMKKSNINQTNPAESKTEISQFNKIFDENVLNTIFENYTNNYFDNDPNIEIPSTQYFDPSDSTICGVNEQVLGLLIYYYNYTFAHYFEDEVLVEYSKCNKFRTDDIIKNNKDCYYTREFDKKYDFQDLLIQTSSIPDYNLRDFFQTIIKDTNKTSQFALFEWRKTGKNSNERESFLNSKYKRIWNIYIFGFVTIFKKIIDNYSVIKGENFKRSKLFDELHDKNLNTMSDLIRIITKISVSGFPNRIDNMTSVGLSQKHMFILSFIRNHFKSDIYRICNLNRDLIKKFNKDVAEEYCKAENDYVNKIDVCYRYNLNRFTNGDETEKYLNSIIQDIIIDIDF